MNANAAIMPCALKGERLGTASPPGENSNSRPFASICGSLVLSLAVVTVLWLSDCLAASNEVSAVKPNLIFVLLDDVSAKEFTCYGGQGINTPTLDRMAREIAAVAFLATRHVEELRAQQRAVEGG